MGDINMGIEHLDTMTLGKKYKGFYINHDEHYSSVTYIFYCGKHTGACGDTYHVLATNKGFVLVDDHDHSLVAGEWQHHDEGGGKSVIVYDEGEDEEEI